MNQERVPDPFNLIITGVGGQGNVMASRVIGNMLSKQGYLVTIGETFGASQRGGSVMSHLRISRKATFSPLIARGRAHMVMSLEPSEALRVLSDYGNPGIKVITNVRSVHSVGVISGEQTYTELDQLKEWINELSDESWYVNATELAIEKMGHPIFGNILLLGALAKVSPLPLSREDFESVISQTLPKSKVGINMQAFDMGAEVIG